MAQKRRAELEALGFYDDQGQQTLVDLGLAPQPTRLEETPQFMGEEVVTSMEDVNRIEEATPLRPSPATRLFDEAIGVEGTPVDQRFLADEDYSFNQMRSQLEDARAERRRLEEQEQASGRAEAEANRAQFPDPLPVSEEARRTAITAPLLRSPQLPDGGPLAQTVPKQGFRDLEFEAMGIQELIEGPEEATLTPDVKYRYDRITSSKKMLDNPYSWYSGTSKEDKPDWAVLVEKLYNPKKGEMEDLQNAWEQITISYSDNRAIMEKAHDYLLFIDRAEAASKKAQ